MGTTNTLDLNNRVSELEKAVSGGDSARANKSDIATDFSATTSYTAGCFVYYGGKLYQFNADHSAGAWDPTDVVEANVTDQVVSNKAAIDGLTASDVAYDNTDSGLTATDVQGAVDELGGAVGTLNSGVGELGSKLIEVTADGVKTYSQLLDQLYPYRSRSYRIDIDSTQLYPATATRYGNVGTTSNDDVNIRSINIKETGSTYKAATIVSSTGAVSVTDLSSGVATEGMKIKLVKAFL